MPRKSKPVQMNPIPIPEHNKMVMVKHESQIVGDFLEWLDQQGMTICNLVEDYYCPVRLSREQLLAKYFGIDLDKIEQENRAILDYARKITGSK